VFLVTVLFFVSSLFFAIWTLKLFILQSMKIISVLFCGLSAKKADTQSGHPSKKEGLKPLIL